jgi:diguanylate cyclase (GGDEF)-like protein
MMGAVIERDVLAELSTAMAAYLRIMTATGECLEKAWPEIGEPYRKRIQGLHSRLSFDVTRAAIKESSETLATELKDFAGVVNRARTESTVDLERGILALRDMIDAMSRQQNFYSQHLRALATEAGRVADPEQVAAALTSLAEIMKRETAPELEKMDQEAALLGERLAGPAAIDPITGLINRTEFQRQVAAYQLNGTMFSILLFRLGGPLGDQVMQQVASRLSAEFRRRDRVGRWSKNEFAVLFAGASDKAEERAVHSAARLDGPYALVNGEVVHITAEVMILPASAEL